MNNTIIFHDLKNSIPSSSLINTTSGSELLQIINKRSLLLREIRDEFTGTIQEMMTTLNQFFQAGLLSHQNMRLSLTLPLITGEDLRIFRKELLPTHQEILTNIAEYLSSSFYKKRLDELSLFMDVDEGTLNFLLTACFGILWGGEALFHGMEAKEKKAFILIQGDLGLSQSMSSYTSHYTFSSFGYAKEVFRESLGNLLNPKTLMESSFYSLDEEVRDSFSLVLGFGVEYLLDTLGDLLLALKKGVKMMKREEMLLEFLRVLGYVEGKRLLVPLFLQELNPILIELIEGFQKILYSFFQKGSLHVETDNDFFTSPGVHWALQVGQLNSLLLEGILSFPKGAGYQSMVFGYPVSVARSLLKRYPARILQYSGGEM